MIETNNITKIDVSERRDDWVVIVEYTDRNRLIISGDDFKELNNVLLFINSNIPAYVTQFGSLSTYRTALGLSSMTNVKMLAEAIAWSSPRPNMKNLINVCARRIEEITR